MKAGAENRTKTIALGVLAAIAVCGVLYNLFSLFGGPSTPPPVVAPVSSAPAPAKPGTVARAVQANQTAPGGSGAIPGVAAQKIASSNGSLDPTLDQAAMLRTESLVYSGSGRNIFAASFVTAPALALPTHMPPARPNIVRPTTPAYIPPAGPPPIPLKFFGTAQRPGGPKQAFLLSGDDVYLANPGDIVARRFRIGQIQPFSVTVTDLGSNNTQTLPLQQQ